MVPTQDDLSKGRSCGFVALGRYDECLSRAGEVEVVLNAGLAVSALKLNFRRWARKQTRSWRGNTLFGGESRGTPI